MGVFGGGLRGGAGGGGGGAGGGAGGGLGGGGEEAGDVGAGEEEEELEEGHTESAGDLFKGEGVIEKKIEEAGEGVLRGILDVEARRSVHPLLPPRGRFCARADVSSESEKRKWQSENMRSGLVFVGL